MRYQLVENFDPVKFGRLVQEHRMPLNHIADFSGVTPQAIRKWKAGTSVPSKRCYEAVMEVLGK